MTLDTALHSDAGLTTAIASEYGALADLLEESGPAVWDAPSLCVGWRTREVVAHMTMPARYSGPAFMAELEAAGGDFTRLSDTVAARMARFPWPRSWPTSAPTRCTAGNRRGAVSRARSRTA